MTFADFILVQKEVEIPGRRSPFEAEVALNAVCGRGSSAIFNGSVKDFKGRVRMKGMMNQSARALSFHLVSAADGCAVKGVLRPVIWLRAWQLLFAAMFLFVAAASIAQAVRYHTDMGLAVIGSLLPLIGGLLFAQGYLWAVVLFTRRIERTLLRSVEYIIRDAESARVATDLLSSSR